VLLLLLSQQRLFSYVNLVEVFLRSAYDIIECGDRIANVSAPGITLASTESVAYAVAQLVEALRYKPEGRGFDSR
jgi:hypothetical protein